MEEDKKILKSIVKVNKDFLQGIENQTINQKEITAIENILNRLEELEKENKELKEQNINLNGEIIIYKNSVKTLPNFYDYYSVVPKYKIEDKIKELEEQFDYYRNRDSYAYEDGEFDGETIDDLYSKIQILKQLLEE